MLNLATLPMLGTVLLLAASFVQWNSIVVLLRPRETRRAWFGLLGLFLLILYCCTVVTEPHPGAAEQHEHWLFFAAYRL